MSTVREAPGIRLDLPFELPFLVRALDGDAEVDMVPIAAVERLAEGSFRLSGRGRRFDAEARWERRGGVGFDRWDVALRVTYAGSDATPRVEGGDGTSPLDAGLVIAVRLGATDDPHWLIPGLFYGENRAPESRAVYPRFGTPGTDPWASRAWAFRADRAATPLVYARDREHGVALATTEVGPLGENGVGFRMEAGPHAGAQGPEILLTFPYREEPFAYDGSPAPRPPDRPTHRWEPGETVTFHFRAYATKPAPYAWAPVLADAHDDLAATAPLHPWVDVRAAADLAAAGLLEWHVRDNPPVILETADFDRPADGTARAAGDREAMHVGWLSGTVPAAALLAHGRRTGGERAALAGAAVLDFIAGNLAPCGTFWGQWTADRGWTKGWTPGEDQLHARTIAEATLFMLRAAVATGPPGDDPTAGAQRWREAVLSNLDFVVAHQRDDGAIAATWHARTGNPGSWEGSAALAWVPALVEGARGLGREDLLAAARRAGAFYAPFVDAELLLGAPEDVDLGPTSEDGYVAVMAYVALAESDDGPERERWLGVARRAADWMLTFRYAYNVTFDADTALGRLDYRTRGMDQASPANQHVHTYGLVALAETIRLGRITGDVRLIERSRELFAAARQLIARFDGDFGARRGMVPERAYQTACFGPKGEIGRLSHAWCLGLLLWACEQFADLPELAEAAVAEVVADPR